MPQWFKEHGYHVTGSIGKITQCLSLEQVVAKYFTPEMVQWYIPVTNLDHGE